MFDIFLNNLLSFPANLWNSVFSFISSLYNPNVGILENLYYNDYIWFGLALWLLIKTGGEGWLYIIIVLPFIWLLGHITIKFIGIEFFFLLLIVVCICYYWRKGFNNILDIIFKIIKYVLIVAIGSYIILAVFGPLMFFTVIMIVAIIFIFLAIRSFLKKIRNE